MRIQLKAIRMNVSRNTTLVTNISNFRITRLPRVRSNKDLKLEKSIIDFIPLSPFLERDTKIVFDPEGVEEEGLEESIYPKPALSELGF